MSVSLSALSSPNATNKEFCEFLNTFDVISTKFPQQREKIRKLHKVTNVTY